MMKHGAGTWSTIERQDGVLMKLRFTNQTHQRRVEFTPKHSIITRGVASCLVPFANMMAIGKVLCPNGWHGCPCFYEDADVRGLLAELVYDGKVVGLFESQMRGFDHLLTFLQVRKRRHDGCA